jgi:hypothetical protein
MRLASTFKWEDLQTKTLADGNFRMTNLLPAIKSASLRIVTIFFSCHTCYIGLRLALGENRPLSINAYYGFNTSSSPVYELINISQVFSITYSLVGIVTGWTAEWSEFESRWNQEFSLLLMVQTGSGAHPASYTMGTGANSLPTNVEVKKNLEL